MLFTCLLLFGLVFLVFSPATRNAFVNYDDTVYVTENPHIQTGLTWANLKWAFMAGYAANWNPLTCLSHMIDCQFYGIKPSGHHLTSILIHALNAMLLFLALQRMTGAFGRSFAVAVLFGVHPLRVESVAWVAERKDVLSGLFFMLTLLAYTQYVQLSNVRASKFRLFYILALAMFAFGLMSKPMLVTVPFILLLLDWWPLNRVVISKAQASSSVQQSSSANAVSSTLIKLLLEKAPFFLLAAASSVVTFKVQQSGAAIIKTLPLAARVENAWVSYCRYLGKLFWPVDLAVYYPHTTDWPLTIILPCAIAIAGVSTLAVMLSRRHPYLPVGWFWYLGMLVPVIGLVQVGTQSMADRYTYLPVIGILVMIVWGMHELASHRWHWKVALSTVGAAATFACIALTHRQIGYWHNSETLFRHSLSVTKENGVALDNLGRALGENGQFDRAMEQFRAALKLNANDSFAYSGLGVLLMKKHDYDGAATFLREALRFDPKNAITHYDLGILMARSGSLDEAINQFEDAVQINPDYADARNNLGTALAMSGRFDDAISEYREAIRLKPGNAQIHKNLGVVLVENGRLDEAIEEFREAVRLQPDFAEAQERLQATLELKVNTGPQANPASKP